MALRGISANGLAAEAGMSQGKVHRILRGTAEPTLGQLLAIAEALNVSSVDALLAELPLDVYLSRP